MRDVCEHSYKSLGENYQMHKDFPTIMESKIIGKINPDY